MTLISLLVVLMLEHFFRISALIEAEITLHKWFSKWRKWISAKFDQSWFDDWAGIAVILGFPILLVYVLSNLDNSFLSWMFQLALSVIVMIYCLGPIDQNTHLKKYFAAIERKDLQSAYHHVDEYLNLKADQQKAEDLPALGRVVTRLILSQSNFRYFAVLLYFILFGSAGALLYRLTRAFEFSVRDDQKSAIRDKLQLLRSVMDWLPARMTGFLYSLAGDYTRAMSKLKRYLLMAEHQNKQLLEETGLGALGITSEVCTDVTEENNQALDLVSRSVVVLLVFIAVMTVFGWLG